MKISYDICADCGKKRFILLKKSLFHFVQATKFCFRSSFEAEAYCLLNFKTRPEIPQSEVKP